MNEVHNQSQKEHSHEGSDDHAGHQPKAGGDVDNDIAMGILAYLGILVIIPILVARDSEFAMYHANQGLILLILEAILFAIGIIPILGWLISFLGSIFVLVLVVMGIINVVKKKKKPLPLIGGYQILE